MTEDLVWRCLDCKREAPPTGYDYMLLIKHEKGHHVRLVNKTTGEVLATNPRGAKLKGIILEKAKPGKLDKETMVLDEAGITLPVTLPPVVFTLFDTAKAAGHVAKEMDLDSWLKDCVLKRFELEYKQHLVLVDIEEEK